MNPKILMLIFKEPTAGTHITKHRELALMAGYTMFLFNGVVYCSKSEHNLFNIKDLINPKLL